MVRGIERTPLFRDDTDRADFVGRLAPLAEHGALTVDAWALLPNHAHRLLRTGQRPRARSMRTLLTGYAGAFNRRHKRVGHLCHNRYTSIVVEEERYLLELVRDLHLNPVRAHVVPELRALARYPWSGHRALLGTGPRPWQDTATILAHFGPTRRRALAAYRAFVAAGLPQGRRPEFQGGGLIRSLGGWAAVPAPRRSGARGPADARILGTADFVAAIRREASDPPGGWRPSRVPLATLAARLAASVGVTVPALVGGTQTHAVVTARQLLGYVWVELLGRRASDLARAVGQTQGNVSWAARRGAVHAARWHAHLPAWCR
jgi:REP element-mobilizing transposase RayT